MNDTEKNKLDNIVKANTNVNNKSNTAINKVKNSNIKLYPSQERAVQQLEDWYKSNELFCTLEGYAGTGKTFIMKYFIENIIDKTWTISAPTHKALRVLENTVNHKGKTLHSLLGLKPNVDLTTFDPTNPQYDQLSDLKIVNYKIVLLDECSMVNTGLFNRITKVCANHKIKVLYIGDSLQLPPVKENMSPTFATIKRKVVLDTIVRQEEGNPLLELFSLIRYDIQNKGNTFFNYIINNRSNIINDRGYELLYREDFKSKCIEEIGSESFIGNNKKGIPPNTDYIRILSYTNNNVLNWNQYVRNNLLGDNLPVVCMNDLFTSYNTIMNEFSEPIILNSEDYIIYELIDYVSDEGIKTFGVNLQSMYDERKTDPFLIVDHTDASFNLYKRVLQTLYINGLKRIGGGWKAYYNFKNRFLTLIPVVIHDAYGNEKVIKKDIDYGFGLSVHKSQGSTFDNVAVDLTDITWYQSSKGYKKAYDINMRNRLIYVALSRARKKAILKY